MVKIFGEQAENIQDGDLFKAVVTSVEGRKVVELVSTSIELESESEEPRYDKRDLD
jgi:hypothetical protein